MRSYSPMRLPPATDVLLRKELRKTDMFLRQLTPQIARTVSLPQGTANTTSNGFFDVNGLLKDYLYLPGRLPRQDAKGNVKFDADDGVDAQPLGTITGLSLTGTKNKDIEVYFLLTGPAVARWAFPSLTTTPQDSIFVATSGSQRLASKTHEVSCKYLFDGSASGGFLNSTETKQFNLTFASGFPTTSQNSPAIQMPALDTVAVAAWYTSVHSWCVIHSNASAPFPAGSILYGSSTGGELYGLTIGTAGRLLQTNATSALACTLNSTTTVTSAALFGPVTVGQRVTGNGISEDTTVTAKASTSSLTISQAATLTGASTLTFFGPTWTGALTGTLSVIDNNFTIIDNVTATKIARFECSGITAGATRIFTFSNAAGIIPTISTGLDRVLLNSSLLTGNRTLSFPDVTATFIMSAGPTGGQSIGNGSLTDALAADVSFGGSVGIGNSNIFGASKLFFIDHTTGEDTFTAFNLDIGVSTQSQSITGFAFLLAGTAAGDLTINGFSFQTTVSMPTLFTWDGAIISVLSNPVTVSGSIINRNIAALLEVQGGVAGTTFNEIGGVKITASNGSAGSGIVTYGVYANVTGTGSVTESFVFGADGGAVGAGPTTWSLLWCPTTVTGPTNIWGLNIAAVINNRLAGKLTVGSSTAPTDTLEVTGAARITTALRVGSAATPTHFVEVAAGTTTKAPILLTSGTNLTAQTAGAVEYDGTDFYVTDATALRSRIAPRILSRTTGINGNAVAATTLYTVPAGRTLVTTQVVMRTTTVTALLTNPTYNVKGAVAGNIVASRVGVFTAAGQCTVAATVDPQTEAPAAQVVSLDITVAGTGTTLTLAVDLIGYLF